MAPTSLTETAIRRLEQRDTHPVRRGPFNQIERLSASNRMEVLCNLYFVYYRNLNLLIEVYNPFDRFYRVISKLVFLTSLYCLMMFVFILFVLLIEWLLRVFIINAWHHSVIMIYQHQQLYHVYHYLLNF